MASRRERARRREELAALAALMALPAGRRWMYNLLAECHVYSPSFATNAMTMAWNEGNRNVGLRLTADVMEAVPDQYLAMLKENGSVRPDRDDDNNYDREYPDTLGDADTGGHDQ